MSGYATQDRIDGRHAMGPNLLSEAAGLSTEGRDRFDDAGSTDDVPRSKERPSSSRKRIVSSRPGTAGCHQPAGRRNYVFEQDRRLASRWP